LFQHDYGTAEGQKKADEDRFPQRHPQAEGNRETGDRGKQHLQRSSDQDGTPDIQQLIKRKFHADGKQ